jgi:putative transposase
MSEYRRLYRQEGWYFFTVVTYNREKILIQPDNLKRLRLSFHHVMTKYPFIMDAGSFYPIIFTASGAYLLTMTIFQRAGS